MTYVNDVVNFRFVFSPSCIGANVNQKDHFGRSPLHVAAAVDYADMVEFLLQHGADINIITNEEGQTPIHFAAKNDAINSLQMLLAYGADIDSRDSKNRTPLQVSQSMDCEADLYAFVPRMRTPNCQVYITAKILCIY